MEGDSDQVRLRLLSPQLRLTEDEMKVPANTVVRDLKIIILTRLQCHPEVKVGLGNDVGRCLLRPGLIFRM